MYEVKYTDKNGETFKREFDDLVSAMDWAKSIEEFVTITGGDLEVVGKFGVDSIINGKCPDGVDYTWKKRRI